MAQRRKHDLVVFICATTIAASLLYWSLIPDGDSRPYGPVSGSQSVEAFPKESILNRPVPSTLDTTDSRQSANAESNESISQAVRSGFPAATNQDDSSGDSARQTKAEGTVDEDTQVVREESTTTFTPSEAINDTCAKYASDPQANCSGQQEVLVKLSREARDHAWANARESEIRAAVTAIAGFQVRAINCRTTVCVLEVESNLGSFRSTNFRSLKAELELVDLINGYERTSAALLTTVTLITFQRKS